jgi:hypothetical protein
MLQNLLPFFSAFEADAQRFDPTCLVATGLALLAAGLIIWLAGISFGRLITALITAVAAFIAAMTLAPGSTAAVVLACTGGLIVGALLKRPVLAIVSAALVASCMLAVLAPATETTMVTSFTPPKVANPSVLSPGDTWRHARLFGKDCYTNVSRLVVAQPRHVYIVMGAAAILTFLITIAFKNFGTAFGCSGLGTVMSLLGMVVVLFQKGSEPVKFISNNGSLVAAIFGGMVVFGVIIQLLLARPQKGRATVVVPPHVKQHVEESQPEPKTPTVSLKPDGQ